MEDNFKPMNVSVEQSKLLGNALRIKIISVLQDEARTAKQVADLLGHSPGSVHYHIQKLKDGNLIELVEIKLVSGIQEKYYKARSKWFNSDGGMDPALNMDYENAFSSMVHLRLFLKEEQRDELMADFRALLEKWVGRTTADLTEDTEEYAVGIKLASIKKESSQ